MPDYHAPVHRAQCRHTGGHVMANSDRALIEGLYARVLSATTAPDLTERMSMALAATWESIGDYSGAAKTREQFAGQLQGFGKLIPDLKWEIVELIDAGSRF